MELAASQRAWVAVATMLAAEMRPWDHWLSAELCTKEEELEKRRASSMEHLAAARRYLALSH